MFVPLNYFKFTGPEPNITAVPPSDSVNPGDSVTRSLRCLVVVEALPFLIS